jgi:hypothetical protein
MDVAGATECRAGRFCGHAVWSNDGRKALRAGISARSGDRRTTQMDVATQNRGRQPAPPSLGWLVIRNRYFLLDGVWGWW